MDPHTEEAVTGLQCLLSVTDARDPQEFIVSLCKSGSPLDVLLQALLKVNESKKADESYSDGGLCQVDAILSHSFRRLEEEINNCVEVCHQLDTELEVSVFARLEQFLEFCAQRIQKNMLSVTVLSCLSIIFDPNASFNKTEVWCSNATYPKGSQLTQLINYFGTCDGFESVRQCLRHAKDMSIAQLAALLRPFGQCYRQLSTDTIKRYFLPVSDAVCAHLLSCSDRQLFQQDVTPTELPASLVGPRAAYVVVESVMNLLNLLKEDDLEAQSKVQYWQDTILTRLKHALEDEANSSDSSSSSNSKATSQLSRRLSQESNASVASRGSLMSGSQDGSEKNTTSSRSCQTLPCVVNSVTHETLDLVDKLSRTISEAAGTSDITTTVTAKDNGDGTKDTGVMVAQEAVTLDMGSLPGATNQAEVPADPNQPSTSYGNLTSSEEATCRASAEVIPKEVIIWNPPVFETAYATSSSKPIATMFDSSESSSMVSTAPSVPRSASELGNSCRVCFEGETSSKNRLIRPCRCSGSAASIHRQCLVKWIHISGHRRCEVCGARFSYIPMSERMRGFMDKFRNNRRWRNAAFAILVGLVVVLYLIIFAVFPRGIMSE